MYWFIGFAIGGLAVTLALLDTFLSLEQKASVDRVHMLIWSKLDDWKRRSISDWLFNPDNRRLFAFVAMVPALGFLLWDATQEYTESFWWSILIYVAAVPLGALTGWVLLIFTLRRGIGSSVFRAVIVFIVMGFTALAVGTGYLVWADVDFTEYYGREGNKVWEGVIIRILFHALWTAAMFWWAAFIPLIVVMFARVLLVVAEFVFRRICEAKDGAINTWSRIFRPIS